MSPGMTITEPSRMMMNGTWPGGLNVRVMGVCGVMLMRSVAAPPNPRS